MFRQLKHKMAAILATFGGSGNLQFIKIHYNKVFFVCKYSVVMFSVGCKTNCVVHPKLDGFHTDNKTLDKIIFINNS